MRMAGLMGGGSDGIYSCVSGRIYPGSCTCDCLGIMCVQERVKGVKDHALCRKGQDTAGSIPAERITAGRHPAYATEQVNSFVADTMEK